MSNFFSVGRIPPNRRPSRNAQLQALYGNQNMPQSYPPSASRWSQLPSNDKKKFTPSRSLREHIMERLDLQEECLDELSARNEELKKFGEHGKENSTGKSPGDEQIDGEMISQVKQGAAGLAVAGMGAGGLATLGTDIANAVNTQTAWWSRRASMGATPFNYLAQPPASDEDEEEDDDDEDDKGKLDEDPLEKYIKLDHEIRMLANMSTVPNKNSSNPFQAAADQWDLSTNPHKALAKRLPEILGPGGGSKPSD